MPRILPLIATLLLTTALHAQQPATQPARPTTPAIDPYTLPEAEVFKRILPPFPDNRLDIYRAVNPDQANAIPQGPTSMILQFDNGNLSQISMIFVNGRATGGGFTLRDIITRLLHIPDASLEGDDTLLKKMIEGDLIVRKDAPEDQLLAALAKLTAEESNDGFTLTRKLLPTPCLVLKGEWTGNVPSPQKPALDIYGDIDLHDPATKGRTVTGDIPALQNAINLFTNKPILLEPTGNPQTLSWTIYDSRNHDNRKPARDPDAIAKHLAEQTGLTLSEESRNLPHLIIEPPESLPAPPPK